MDAPCVVDDVVDAIGVVSIVDETVVEELVVDEELDEADDELVVVSPVEGSLVVVNELIDDELDKVEVELIVVSSVVGSLVGSKFLSSKILIISFIIEVYLLCS